MANSLRGQIKWLKYNGHLTRSHADRVLAALDKQEAKPKHKYKGYRCVCGEEVAKNQRYCEYCGQKLLDWEGD